jgi:hypothetical protein
MYWAVTSPLSIQASDDDEGDGARGSTCDIFLLYHNLCRGQMGGKKRNLRAADAVDMLHHWDTKMAPACPIPHVGTGIEATEDW